MSFFERLFGGSKKQSPPNQTQARQETAAAPAPPSPKQVPAHPASAPPMSGSLNVPAAFDGGSRSLRLQTFVSAVSNAFQRFRHNDGDWWFKVWNAVGDGDRDPEQMSLADRDFTLLMLNLPNSLAADIFLLSLSFAKQTSRGIELQGTVTAIRSLKIECSDCCALLMTGHLYAGEIAECLKRASENGCKITTHPFGEEAEESISLAQQQSDTSTVVARDESGPLALAGSVWHYQEPDDPDRNHHYLFEPDGTLSDLKEKADAPLLPLKARWRQEGELIYIEFQNIYTGTGGPMTRLSGRMTGDRMQGTANGLNGNRWAWLARRLAGAERLQLEAGLKAETEFNKASRAKRCEPPTSSTTTSAGEQLPARALEDALGTGKVTLTGAQKQPGERRPLASAYELLVERLNKTMPAASPTPGTSQPKAPPQLTPPPADDLLAAGADVNARDTDGKTALIRSAEKGSASHVNALIAARADVNAKSNHGRTALMGAALKGDSECVKALIAAGADVNAKDCHPAGPDVPLKVNYGRTALMAAASALHADCIKALIAAGANVNAKDGDGTTALIKAAFETGSLECIKALIAAGADVNAKNTSMGHTALKLVAVKGDIDHVKTLIAAGADVNAKDNAEWTALMWSAEQGKTDSVKTLIAAGADVNSKNFKGHTALTWAVKNAHEDVVAILRAAGAT